ncbi:MAG: hypothetical protein IPK82_16890 [Polyangiaceae bacterium]|nr:hypothetical protein [Polyangiaceae bacterium]
MSIPVTVSALAVADGPADAVGVVQLACEEDSLALTLLRAGAYRHGFVPGTLAESVTLHVPYAAVRGLVKRGKALVLTLDKSVPSPFHRFALARFTDNPAETLAPIHRVHRWASSLSWMLPGPMGALAAALPPEQWVGGALGRASLALLIALVSGAAMRALAAWLAWGGPISDRHREAFESAISERLGLLPKAPPKPVAAARGGRLTGPSVRLPEIISTQIPQSPGDASVPNVVQRPNYAPPAELRLTPPETPTFPWLKGVVLSAVVAVSLVTGVLFYRHYGHVAPKAPVDVEPVVDVPKAPVPPPAPAPEPPPRPERCFCERADSPLWREGIPVLSVFTTTGPDAPITVPEAKLDEHDNPVFNYHLAVVNNGARTIDETRVVLTYARRDSQNRRVAVTDRGLYWGLPLGPGKAVKWVTEGPGTEVRIDKSEQGTLQERNIPVAPADAFFALTKAKHRVVRMHAAMMLAYHHDSRAVEAISLIGPPMGVESWTIRRIQAAARPTVACDIQVSEGQLSVCVFNASTQAQSGVAVQEIQDDEAKPARSWPVPMEVPVHDGVRLRFDLTGDPPGDLVVK